MASPLFWKRYVRPHLLRLRLAAMNRYPNIRRDMLTEEQSELYLDQASEADLQRHDYAYPDRSVNAESNQLVSCLCNEKQLSSPAFRYWIRRLGNDFHMHRKLWELSYLLQALYERDMLQSGRSGLGFAVGQEPLPDIFAQMGCNVLATDLDVDDKRVVDWRETDQHISGRKSKEEGRNKSAKNIDFRAVDMNHIPDDLGLFDFTWSTCSFEHCGSISLGTEFIWNQMKCLKPGGVAVHTTEFNLTSNKSTLDQGSTVIYRRRDIEQLIQGLTSQGHEVEPLSLDTGVGEFDKHVDWPPYTYEKHLRLMINRYVTTSVGLIIRKAESAKIQKPSAA